jgi:hypothetical protein
MKGAALAEAHLELGQHGVTEGFSGDAGAVRNEKDGTGGGRQGGRCSCVM